MFLSIIGSAISVSALIIAYWVMSIIGFIRAIAKRRKALKRIKRQRIGVH